MFETGIDGKNNYDFRSIMQKFIIKIIVFSLFLAFALYGVRYIMPQFEIVPFYFLSILFFMLLTIVIYSMLLRGLKKDNKKFVYAFYLTTIIRLFGSIAVLFIYLVISGKNNLHEAVVFIILYFLYTGFEIVNLFPTLRPEIRENQNK
jgi:Na+/melibiose symporter-like transporter